MDYNTARRNMIKSQLRPNKITDEALIASIASAPRERFLPEELRGIAYVDEDLRIGAGRSLLEPVILARLLQELELAPGDAVLDIASGTGYAAAVMARLAGSVFALESDKALQTRASELFAELALDNVVPVEGDLIAGCAEHAPFNAILIEGAVDYVPQAILDQLAEGGRLAAVVMDRGVGRATLYRRDGGHLSSRVVCDAYVPALAEFAAAPEFRL